MIGRRTAIKSAMGLAGGLVVDPTGWLGRVPAQQVPVDDYDEVNGFVLLKPRQPRPPAIRLGPPIEASTESTPARSPSLRTLALRNLSQAEQQRGGLGRVTVEARSLMEASAERIEHVPTGEVVMDTLVLKDLSTGRTVALTAQPHVPLPYAVAAIGADDIGFATWTEAPWLSKPGIAMGNGHVPIGLWLDFDTLFRLEVAAESPIGPRNVEAILGPVARAMTVR